MTAARATIAAVLLALLAAAPADAQLRWHGCPEARGVRCARIQVPLDRAGVVPGKVPLRVARVNLGSGRRGTMMYLSGGPGGAGVLEMVDVLLTVPRLIRDFDVLGFDQRGTGRSGLLRCRALERDPRPAVDARRGGVRAQARPAAVLLHDARQRRGHGGDPEGGRRAEADAVRDLLRHRARAGLRAGAPGPRGAADPRLDRRPGRRRRIRARRVPRDDADAARAVPGRVRRRSRPTPPRT